MRLLLPRTSTTQAPRRGSSSVEFALTGGLLLVLLIGLMESAWLFHHYFATVRAAQRGARIAVAIEDDAAALAAATDEVQAALQGFGVSPDDATVTTTVDLVDETEVLTVKVVLDGTQLVGLVPLPDQIESTTSLRREIFVPSE